MVLLTHLFCMRNTGLMQYRPPPGYISYNQGHKLALVIRKRGEGDRGYWKRDAYVHSRIRHQANCSSWQKVSLLHYKQFCLNLYFFVTTGYWIIFNPLQKMILQGQRPCFKKPLIVAESIKMHPSPASYFLNTEVRNSATSYSNRTVYGTVSRSGTA